MITDTHYMTKFEDWVLQFEKIVATRSKVPPDKYRTYEFKQPPHLWSEIKTGLRALKLRFGKASKKSSPEKQQHLNLNRSTTLYPKKTEGGKLRN